MFWDILRTLAYLRIQKDTYRTASLARTVCLYDDFHFLPLCCVHVFLRACMFSFSLSLQFRLPVTYEEAPKPVVSNPLPQFLLGPFGLYYHLQPIHPVLRRKRKKEID